METSSLLTLLFSILLICPDGVLGSSPQHSLEGESRRGRFHQYKNHRSFTKRRWRPRQTRHPLRDLFFPDEAVVTSPLRSHEKRDAVDGGGGNEDAAASAGDSAAAAAAIPIKPAKVFFNPAGSGVGLEPKVGESGDAGGSLKFNNPNLLDSLGLESLEESFKDIHEQESAEKERQFLGGILIEDAARHLGSFVRKLSNDELRVTQMQGIFDSLSKTEKPKTEIIIADKLDAIVRQLGAKLRRYGAILTTNQAAVQELYTSYLWDRSGQLHSGFSPFGVVASQDTPQDCCRLRRDVDVSWSEAWGTYVSTSQSCDLIPTNAAVDEPLFSPGRNLTHVFARNLERNPLVKWQYFISMQGLHVEYPAHNFNDDSHPLLHPQHHHRRNYAASTSMAGGNGGGAASEAGPDACDDAIHARHRDVFVSTVMPRRKNVVIVIDQGRSLSDYQMAIAKAVAKHVLESLSEEDYVGVLALSDKVDYPPSACATSRHSLVPITYETQSRLESFVAGLRRLNALTNHALGFRKAFEMIWKSIGIGNATEDPDEALIVYISRGLLSSLTDAKDILSAIAFENGRMGHRVVINTYAVIDFATPLMFEKSFLRDIAEQNYSKYAVLPQYPAPVRKGVMVAVNSTDDVALQVGDFWKVLWRPGEGGTPSLGGGSGNGGWSGSNGLSSGDGLRSIPQSWWPGNNDRAKNNDRGTGSSSESSSSSMKIRFSLPHMDDSAGHGIGGVVVSLSKPTYYNKRVIGMVGVDVHLGDLMEDVTYYAQLTAPPNFDDGDGKTPPGVGGTGGSNGGAGKSSSDPFVSTSDAPPLSYAFLIDVKGLTLAHPTFSRPSEVTDPPMHTHISHFERVRGFDEEVLENMLTVERGEHVLKRYSNTSGSSASSAPTIKEENESSGDEAASSSEKISRKEEIYAVHYAWRRVPHSPYIVVIRTDALEEEMDVGVGTGGVKIVRQAASSSRGHSGTSGSSSRHDSIPDLMYHRLDLLPPERTGDRLCKHLKQVATYSTSTMFLAPNAFLKPFEHLQAEETWTMVQGYMAWLRDKTGLLSNPGLNPRVRADAIALAKINGDWMNAFRQSQINDHIVRRYVATPTGVLRMFPGTLLSKAYNPLEQRWYTRALQHPGKVVFTGPYLDVGGAGYVVTLSHTIYEGRAASLHSSTDPVVAVMGLDFTLRYFYKELQEHFPSVCKRASSIRCFILDDSGYLIAHQGLIDPNGKGPVEQQHVTHKEPLVANDILNHRWFVRKRLCNSYNDRTIQRFYQFNTSMDGVLTNLVHGEHCAKYQITRIKGTNSFLGVINQTCSMITAFCPCSMMDRLCLNCHRMEQNECECPCECPLENDICLTSAAGLEDDGLGASAGGDDGDGHHRHLRRRRDNDANSPCPRFPSAPALAEPVSEMMYWRMREKKTAVAAELPRCFQRDCSRRGTKDACFAVVDCEWCELEGDGATRINKPFCASQRVCFGGVKGARTPYRDELHDSADARPRNHPIGEPGGPSPSTGRNNIDGPYPPHGVRSAPVGPVAGGIMGCFLVLAVAVYCYRHHVTQSRYAHAYLSAGMGNGSSDLRMNALDDVPPDMEGPNGSEGGDSNMGGGIGNSNFVLATFALGNEGHHVPMAAASMSPYRVNTSPRRPPGGVESDYGYSTMTPHEDTDQQSQADTTVGANVSHPHNRDRYHPSLAIPRPSVSGQPPRITCNPLHSSSPAGHLPSPYATVPASPIPPPPATPSVSSLSTSTSPMDAGVLTSKDLVYALHRPHHQSVTASGGGGGAGLSSGAEESSTGCPSISKDSGIGPYILPPQFKHNLLQQQQHAAKEKLVAAAAPPLPPSAALLSAMNSGSTNSEDENCGKKLDLTTTKPLVASGLDPSITVLPETATSSMHKFLADVTVHPQPS